MVQEQLDIYRLKNEKRLHLNLIPYIKVNSKWTTDLNVNNCKTL